MGLFSLFKSDAHKTVKEDSKKETSVCPVCKADVGPPTRKKKCASCQSEIYARTLLDGTRAWLTEEQIKSLDVEKEHERKKNIFLTGIKSRSTHTDDQSLINKACGLYLNGKRDEAWRNLNSAIIEASKQGGMNLGSAYWDIYYTMGNIVADEKRYKNALSNYILAFYWDRAARLYLEVVTSDDIRGLDLKQDLLESSFFMEPFAVLLELGGISLPEMKDIYLDVLKNQDKVAFAWLQKTAKEFDKSSLRDEDIEPMLGLGPVWTVLKNTMPKWESSKSSL